MRPVHLIAFVMAVIACRVLASDNSYPKTEIVVISDIPRVPNYRVEGASLKAAAERTTVEGFVSKVRIDALTVDGSEKQMTVSFNADTTTYAPFFYDLVSPNLTVGFYDRANRTDFASFGHPGLEFFTLQYGPFNEVCGRYAVLDAQFDYSTADTRALPAHLTSFAAVFDHYGDSECYASSPAGTHGSVYLNYTPTVDVRVDQTDLSSGMDSEGAVELRTPAQPGGTTVSLLSSAPSSVVVPDHVVVPPGERVARFRLKTGFPRSDSREWIMAIANGVGSIATVHVAAIAAPLTRLELDSDPGDFIGLGRQLRYGGGDALFYAIVNREGASRLTKSVEFRIYPPNGFWILDFWSPFKPFPGSFAGAERSGFSGPNPGLDVAGTDNGGNIGRGCNQLNGSFTVFDAEVDYDFVPAKVVSFAASFEQHCEHALPALRGRIYYNYLAPRRRAVNR